MRIPPVVKTLLLLNIAAFAVDMACSNFLGLDLTRWLGLHYVLDPLCRFVPTQFITYMFMHQGLSHIFFNMFALWMFGRIMEQVWGAKRFLIYYIVCGVGAGIIQEIGQALGIIFPLATTIGASGAVYGILLAFGMTFPNERLFIIPFPFPIKAKYFIGIYIVIEVLEGISGKDGVAHFAHLGGMFFGLLTILYWKSKTSKSSSQWNGYYQSNSYSQGNAYDKGEGGFFSKMFKKERKPKMTISYADPNAKDHEYNARKKERNDEIDRILDKVRTSGYQNLTEEEKRVLFDASKR